MRKYVEHWDKAWCHTTLFHVGQNLLQLWSTKIDLIIFFETFCFSDLGYSYRKEKSALRRFLELVIGTVWGIWIWWITLLPQIAFDHRPGGYACHLAAENWVSCRCFGTLAASLCDRVMAVIVCFYMLKTIMKGSEKGASSNIFCQLSGILGNAFCMCIICLFRFEILSIFTPTWGNDPIWLIFLRWVETTN